MKFLQQVAHILLNKHESLFSNLLLLFPNKRAITFFNKHVAGFVQNPIFMPKQITISEYIQEQSHLVIADQIILLSELYASFCKITGSKDTFEEFYYWGEMILSDFDDIDKYLLNAKQVFSNVQDIKELTSFSDYLTENQTSAIKQYWNTFLEKDSKGKEEFLKIWEKLYDVYTDFKEKLREKNIAYSGMVYRDVAERIKTDFDNSYHGVAFIGFVALNKCEEQIFQTYKRSGKAEFYWDTDAYFIEQQEHEAGFFLRDNIREYEPSHEIESNYQREKSINTYSFSSNIAMVKYVAELLNEDDSFEDTAIVVLDDNLLTPLLYSLPEKIKAFNISMGYAFSNTTFFSFFSDLIEIHMYKKKGMFTNKQIERLMNQPLLNQFFPEYCEMKMVELLNSKKYFLGSSFFSDNSFMLKLVDDNLINQSFDVLLEIIINLKDLILSRDETGTMEEIDLEFLFSLYTEVNKLKEALDLSGLHFDNMKLLAKLLKRVLQGIEVTFIGEPLKGMQIVGILETRLLDFEKIVILSANEGYLPKKNVSSSYIPYNLRKGFGMPTVKHQDAMYSYYFYRMMQRVKQAHLLYVESTAAESKAERSRYISQMLFEGIHSIQEKTQEITISVQPEVKINIEASSVKELIEPFFHEKRTLSPTAVNTLIACSLKFYFKYLKGFSVPDEVSEMMQENDFGLIFHKAIEELYKPFNRKEISKEDIGKLIKNQDYLKQILYESIEEVYYLKASEIDGYNEIVFELLLKYLNQILVADWEYAPFSLLGLEREVVYSIPCEHGSLTFKGAIDRLDIKEGIVRPLDYKTGKAVFDFKDVESLFGEKKTNKVTLQTLMYAMLLDHVGKGEYKIVPSVYSLREQMKGGEYKVLKNLEFYSEVKSEFEAILTQSITQIFLEYGFHQTSELSECSYCDFRGVCNR